MAASSAPAATTGRRPRRSATCPASGRLARAVRAKAPTATPTATSPRSNGPRTYLGITGRTAPTAVSESRVTTKMPAKAALGERCTAYGLGDLAARSSARLIFPLVVLGSRSANSTMRGNL